VTAAGEGADGMARAKGELPGWDIWQVPVYQPHGTRWCGRPEGYPVSVAQGDSAGELIANAREWIACHTEAPR
jgi:hypothetical protein